MFIFSPVFLPYFPLLDCLMPRVSPRQQMHKRHKNLNRIKRTRERNDMINFLKVSVFEGFSRTQ